jgi:hypothetical protein
VLAFGLRFTGKASHELIGAATFFLLAVHLAAGRTWIKNLFNGAFVARRRLAVIVNMALFIAAVVAFGSGFVLFLGIDDGMGTRQAHAIAAYWLLVLTGVHVGLYWKNVVNGLRFMARDMTGQRAWRLAGHLPKAGLLFALYGVWASYERNIGSKLFLGFSFDFWNQNWPVWLFFVNHLAVISACVAASMYAARFAGKASPLGQGRPMSATSRNEKKTKNSPGN